jgi:iron-sulfur cluster assembly accessory protein
MNQRNGNMASSESARAATPCIALTFCGVNHIVVNMSGVSDPIISLTPRAVEIVKQIRAKEGLPEGHALRVSVVGGGCSGFSYQLDFSERPEEGDEVVEYDDVRVVVDPTSAEHLRGTQIDYVSSLTGGGFKFSNPKASSTCGCGSSFSA